MLVAALAGAALMIQFESVTVFGRTIPAGVFGSLAVDGVPLGPVGLAIGAALGAWIEWALLRHRLAATIGQVGGGAAALARMFGAAAVAAGAGYGVRLAAGALAPLPLALLVAAAFGCVYLAAAYFLRLGEARAALDALLRRARVR